MISRLFVKDFLSFKSVELKFENGLSVITGESGAGKSVLMSAILAVFGQKDVEAKFIEADFEGVLELGEFGILAQETNTFKLLREKSTRYFVNNQTIAKRNLCSLNLVKYLSAREVSEFENARLLRVLDTLGKVELGEFREKFAEFVSVKRELEALRADEMRLEELKEFAKFEFDKISAVAPKEPNELETLLETKKRLSKREKVEKAAQKASAIFANEKAVLEFLGLVEVDASFFEEAMNELKSAVFGVDFSEFDELDVEKVLDRIEALGGLQKRYGSVEEALAVMKRRKEELARYETIEFEKGELEARFEALRCEVEHLASEVSGKRSRVVAKFENGVNGYLKKLYLNGVSVGLKRGELTQNGWDEVVLNLGAAELKKISSGELNRLRLAFLAFESKVTRLGSGVLILDEVDSNLSGKEAMSIANVLVELGEFYQIFAISHQPQLSSKAHHHFLVERVRGVADGVADGGEFSVVREIFGEERVGELSRMISGEDVSEEARRFAKKMFVQKAENG